MIGFPEFFSEQAEKNCDLLIVNNPITSFEGGPRYIGWLRLDHVFSMTSLESSPIVHSSLELDHVLNIDDLTGLKTDQTDPDNAISVILRSSDIISLRGCPKEVSTLTIINCGQLKNLDGFPNKVSQMNITYDSLENSSDGLMYLHELYHDKKAIKTINILEPISEEYEEDLDSAFDEISDPFEFQDWCIQNGWEKYL